MSFQGHGDPHCPQQCGGLESRAFPRVTGRGEGSIARGVKNQPPSRPPSPALFPGVPCPSLPRAHPCPQLSSAGCRTWGVSRVPCPEVCVAAFTCPGVKVEQVTVH